MVGNDEVDAAEPGFVYPVQIAGIEKIDSLLSIDKIERTGYHRPAIPGSFIVHEDEIGIFEMVADFFRLFQQIFSRREHEIGDGDAQVRDKKNGGESIKIEPFFEELIKEPDGVENADGQNRENETPEHPRMVRRDTGIEDIDKRRKNYEIGNKKIKFFVAPEIDKTDQAENDEIQDAISSQNFQGV